MNNPFWEHKEIVCDVCRERPVKKTIEISRGHWIGICVECENLSIRKINDILKLKDNKNVK